MQGHIAQYNTLHSLARQEPLQRFHNLVAGSLHWRASEITTGTSDSRRQVCNGDEVNGDNTREWHTSGGVS